MIALRLGSWADNFPRAVKTAKEISKETETESLI